MRRRRRRRRHFALRLLLIGLIAIVAVTLFLIYRGAKVSGPDATSPSASHRVIDTTPTTQATHTKTATYTARGAANDPDGEDLTVQVTLYLNQSGHYRRKLQIKGDTLRTIVDSGTYSGTSKTLKLTSTEAVIFTYRSAAKMKANHATTTSHYGEDYASYPSYLSRVLDNRVTLKKGVAKTYRYVAAKLTLQSSSKTVPTVDAAITAAKNSAAVTASSTDAADSASSDSSSTDSSDNSDSADSNDSSTKLTVASAQAIVEQQYPSSDYDITAMGQTGDTFTFVVINQDTHANQYVTVNADGEIQ